MKNILLLLALITSTAFGAGKLQDSDFATGAAITGAGGSLSQLLNVTKIYDTVNAQALNTTLGNVCYLTGNQSIGGTKTFTSTIAGSINGNAATATALAANPTDCGVGEFATAIDAQGNLTCSTPAGSGTVNSGAAGSLALYPATATTVDDVYVQNTNNINISIASHPTLAASRTYTIPEAGASASFVMTEGAQTVNGVKTFGSTIAGSINGNAATATALAANPADCGANQFATTIAANGDLTCSAISVSDLPAPAASAISASDIDWSILKVKGGVYTKTLGANTTFTFSNLAVGTIVVRLTNTASNYTVTWPTVKWSNNATPVMTIGAKSDIYTFVYDGTDVFGSVVQNF